MKVVIFVATVAGGGGSGVGEELPNAFQQVNSP